MRSKKGMIRKKPGTFSPDEPSQPEYNAPFVFLDDLDCHWNNDQDNKNDYSNPDPLHNCLSSLLLVYE